MFAPMPINNSIQKPSTNPEQFQQQLLTWYTANGRHHLPWRNTRDAYHILLSEIMLQQTQVETVLSRYYDPFLEKFPNLDALKKASIESVMHAWQGLGYYRRAGYLHEIAKRSAPELPNDFESLILLPGIGKNTAHALLAFAHHQPYAVMEANVKRVVSRIFALKHPSENELWSAADLLLNKAEPFNHNQAMMDLGSLICSIKNPKCPACPAQNICAGKYNPKAYPRKKQKTATPTRKRNIIVVQNADGRIYAKPREGKLLGGLYQFIELENDAICVELNGRKYWQTTWQKLGNIRQQYSHFKLEADVFLLRYDGKYEPKHWHSIGQLQSLPWSNAEKKILSLLKF
jgi:A/G-specific adenine glycosylase